MIRTWPVFYGLQSQSMLMLIPFPETRCTFAADTAAFSPTHFAWRILSEKAQQWKDALMGGFPYIMPNDSLITIWGICRSFGKTSYKN
jgi:hypothetical protein